MRQQIENRLNELRQYEDIAMGRAAKAQAEAAVQEATVEQIRGGILELEAVLGGLPLEEAKDVNGDGGDAA